MAEVTDQHCWCQSSAIKHSCNPNKCQTGDRNSAHSGMLSCYSLKGWETSQWELIYGKIVVS